MKCPCLGPHAIDDCCGRFLSGHQFPTTATELMRSRYTAFYQKNIDYLVSTHHPSTVGELDREAIATWANNAQWEHFEILNTTGGEASDTEGTVEFIVRYREKGTSYNHHEISTFEKVNGRWYFKDGEIQKPRPVSNPHAHVGRNDPCPCGSGKKYKKCCLA